MTRLHHLLAACLVVATAGGCAQGQPNAVSPATRASGAVEALAKGASAPMTREQAAAFVKVLDKNGDGQLTHDEGHMVLLWGSLDYLSNKPDIFDPAKPGKPIPAAMVVEKMTQADAKFTFSGAIGVKDQHLVKMGKADIRRLADGVSQVLAAGPLVQRGKIPVRHVLVRHYVLRPGKDDLRWESPRWVAGTIADQLADENMSVTIESGGLHKDGAYQFYFYEHKVF